MTQTKESLAQLKEMQQKEEAAKRRLHEKVHAARKSKEGAPCGVGGAKGAFDVC